MKYIAQVENLCKSYKSFSLDNVTFSLESGKITGFIGINGAGKTTTLKSMFNIVHPSSGNVSFFGMDYKENEKAIKERIGFVSGAFEYYSQKKIKSITTITKSFYKNWDDTAYEKYMKLFSLDENKRPKELSAGMKVKYALTLALSHKAELLILDEPTSGLDPVAREELLDIFLDLSDSGVSIFFSTHITSDLEKCADNIVYIQNGKIIDDLGLNKFVSSYKIVNLENKVEDQNLLGLKRTKNGFSAVIKTDDAKNSLYDFTDATLDQIMIHLEKEK